MPRNYILLAQTSKCWRTIHSPILIRLQSSAQLTRNNRPANGRITEGDRELLSATAEKPGEDGLWRLKTTALVRNIVLGAFFSSPLFFRMGINMLERSANPSSRFLNADRNPLLRSVLRATIYNQFCAGATKHEIEGTRQLVLSAGCAGIILGYGKEMPARTESHANSSIVNVDYNELQHWRAGNLETLDMMGPQDFLAIKFTGAGPRVINALMKNQAAPPELLQAIDDICSKASSKGCRLWIDAEYYDIQPTIDAWTINMMRKYNHGRVLVYNTLQAYLKNSRQTLQRHVRLASKEGWHLGIKLVRGAYIKLDPRHLIHDTKEETDKSYNSIARDLLCGSATNLGLSKNEEVPKIRLFLAGHNPESISMAWELTHQLEQAGLLKTVPDFGQLQGMGDQVSCRLLQRAEQLSKAQQRTGGKGTVPKIYKYSLWGSVQECMAYLLRRVHENSGGADRMKDGVAVYKNELRRRIWRRLSFGK